MKSLYQIKSIPSPLKFNSIVEDHKSDIELDQDLWDKAATIIIGFTPSDDIDEFVLTAKKLQTFINTIRHKFIIAKKSRYFIGYQWYDGDGDDDHGSLKILNEAPVFPPGSYCIADLCLLLNDDSYLHYMDNFDDNQTYYKKGNDIIGICSTEDDGCYTDSLGRLYGVDAANIAILPAHLVSSKSGAPHPITFKNSFKFSLVDGDIHVNDLVDPSNSFKIFIKGHVDEDEDDE